MQRCFEFCFLLLLFLQPAWTNKGRCPGVDDIYPCTCIPKYDGSCMIRCYAVGISALRNLATIPNLCDGHVHFTLVHSDVRGIPADLWKILLSSKSVDISLMFANVKYIVPPEEGNLPSLHSPGEAYIKIEHSSDVGAWDWSQLKDFVADDELTVVIDDTPLRNLSQDFGMIAKGAVEKVFIDRAHLSSISDGIFQKFHLLYSLSLQGNDLTHISRSVFPRPASKLRYLHLNGNSLTTLPEDLFSDMPSLEIVYLRENKLTIIPAKFFASLNTNKIILIDLVRNPWNCNCDMAVIFKKVLEFVDMGTCVNPNYLKGKEVQTSVASLTC